MTGARPDRIAEDGFAALDDLAPAGPLGVAVSGGGDSVALLHLVRDWAAAHGRRLHVATVDHGLRPESAEEARGVRALAAAHGLDADTLVWRDHPTRGNLQAAARDARRALLARWASERGLSAIALGHTMDDQAETVLMRLARGSGVDGLSGMAARVEIDGAMWIRPLLFARRADLRNWLNARGATWVDDPTNEDPRYDRIKARRALGALGDLGLDAAGVAATADRLRDAREALDESADALAAEAARWGVCGDLRLTLGPLRVAPRELARRVLRTALIRVSGATYGPRAQAEATLLTAIFGLRLGGGRSLHGCLIRPDGPDGVVILREAAAVDDCAEIGEAALWDGRFSIEARAPLDGAEVRPLGEMGVNRLKSLEKDDIWRPSTAWLEAPRAARLSTPSLWRGAAMTAAPLAGYGDAIAARFVGGDAFGRPRAPLGDASA